MKCLQWKHIIETLQEFDIQRSLPIFEEHSGENQKPCECNNFMTNRCENFIVEASKKDLG